MSTSTFVEINSIKFRRNTLSNGQIVYTIDKLKNYQIQNNPQYSWREKFDEKTKKNYYINLKTRKSSWKLPARKDLSEEELKLIDEDINESQQQSEKNITNDATVNKDRPTSTTLTNQQATTETNTGNTNTTGNSNNNRNNGNNGKSNNASTILHYILTKIKSNQFESVTIGNVIYHKVVFEGKKLKTFYIQKDASTEDALYEELFSKQHNRKFFKNVKTKTTTWKLPKEIAMESTNEKKATSPTSDSSRVNSTVEIKNSPQLTQSVKRLPTNLPTNLEQLKTDNLSSNPSSKSNSPVSPRGPIPPKLAAVAQRVQPPARRQSLRLDTSPLSVSSDRDIPPISPALTPVSTTSTLPSPSGMPSTPDSATTTSMPSKLNLSENVSPRMQSPLTKSTAPIDREEDKFIANDVIYIRTVEKNIVLLRVKGQTDPEFAFKEKVDPKTNRKYFINMKTKKSMWKLPKVSDYGENRIQGAIASKDSKKIYSSEQTSQQPTMSENYSETSEVPSLSIQKKSSDSIASSPAPSIESKSMYSTDVESIHQSSQNTEQDVESKGEAVEDVTHNGIVYEVKFIKSIKTLIIKGTSDPKYQYKEKFDKKRNRKYFINIASKKSSWKLPKKSDFTDEELQVFKLKIEKKDAQLENLPKKDISSKLQDMPSTTESTPMEDQSKSEATTPNKKNENETIDKSIALQNDEDAINLLNKTVGRSFRTNSTSSNDISKGSPVFDTQSQHSEGSGSPSSPADDLKRGNSNFRRLRSTFKLNNPPSRRSSSPVSVDSNDPDTQSGFSSDIQDFVINRRLSMGRDNSFSGSVARGDLENIIENAIFHRVGGGEVHTLVAIEAYLYGDASQMQKKQKTRQRVIISIVRDFAGSFGMFFFDKKVAKAKMYQQSLILHSFPLVESPKIKDLEASGANCRFQLIINDTCFTFLTEISLKNRLSLSLSFVSRNQNSIENYNKFIQKIATVDFVQTYHQPIIPPDAMDTAILIRSLLSKRDKSRLDILKNVLRDPTQRDIAMETLADYLTSNNFQNSVAKTFFGLLKEILRIVTSTKLFHLRELFTSRLQQIASADKPVLREFDIPDLVRQLNCMFDAQEDWESRGKLPHIIFSSEFYTESTITKAKFDRARLKKNRSILNSIIQEGVFITILIHTNKSIVASSKGHGLPLFPVKNANCAVAANMTIDNNEELAWLCSLGCFEKDLVNHIYEWAQNSDTVSIFLKGFIATLYDITYKFNNNLGYLMDFPVQLSSEGKTVLFVFSLHVESEMQFTPTKDFHWKDALIFEHHIYQKQYEIDETMRLEQLNHGLFGERWIYAAIAYEKALTQKMKPGFYVAHLRVSEDLDENLVLVPNDRRNIIPMQFIQSSLPSQEEWKELCFRITNLESKHLTDDFLIGEQFIPNEETRFYECKTIWQRFYLAWHQLAQKLNQDDLGSLFTMKILPLDEDSSIHICLFYHVIRDIQEMDEIHWNQEYYWRRQSRVEIGMNILLNPRLHTLFVTHKLHQLDDRVIQIGPMSVDEAVRSEMEEIENPEILTIDKWWLSTLWINSVMCFTQYPKEDTYQFVIFDQWQTYLTRQREEILKLSKTVKSWKEIVLRLKQQESTEKDNYMLENPIAPYIDPVPEIVSWDTIYPLDIDTDMNLVDIVEFDELLSAPSSEEISRFLVDTIIEDSLVIHFDKYEIEECASVILEMIDIIEQQEINEEEKDTFEIVEACKKQVLKARQSYKEKVVSMFQNTIHTDDSSEEEKGTFELSYESNIQNLIHSFDSLVDQSCTLLQVISGVQNTLELMENITTNEIAMDNYDYFVESTISGETLSKRELQILGLPRQVTQNLAHEIPPLSIPISDTEEGAKQEIRDEIVESGILNNLTPIEIFINERRRIDEYERMHKNSLERVGKQYREGFPNYHRGSKLVRF